jgi:putative thioredoxin
MIIEVSDFNKEVIEASRATPVLVDFWAPWCGPCRQLGPALERLAEEENAGFVLAKVNTDLNPDVSRRYHIQSIPAVKLFVDGEVINEFIGALPEPQVRQWLADALPSEARAKVAEARRLLETGDKERAAATLEDVLQQFPEEAEASGLLASVLAFRESERAASLARQAERASADYVELAQAVEFLAELRQRFSSVSADNLDASLEALLASLEALAEDDVDQALGHLVESVRLDRKSEDEAARKACVAVFKILGDRDQLTRKHRRALELVLF